MKRTSLLGLAVLGVSGCGLDKYAHDPTNMTILAIFSGVAAILLLITYLRRGAVQTPLQRREQIRQERNWLRELEAARNDFVVAQQKALDRALELLGEQQKKDKELSSLRLKADAALSRVFRLQEEMLRAGVEPDKVNAWHL